MTIYQNEYQELSPEASERLLNEALTNGGFTVHFSGRPSIHGRYVVGLGGFVVNESYVSADHVRDARVIGLGLESANGFGAWVSDEAIHFDAVTASDDLELALEIGRCYNQQAIWDRVEQRSIYVSDAALGSATAE